jgi:hypothetical protein
MALWGGLFASFHIFASSLVNVHIISTLRKLKLSINGPTSFARKGRLKRTGQEWRILGVCVCVCVRERESRRRYSGLWGFEFPAQLAKQILTGVWSCTSAKLTLDKSYRTRPNSGWLPDWWQHLWSSGQSSWLQIQRSWFDSRRYQISWDVVGLERGP